jgi:hypothetical protein
VRHQQQQQQQQQNQGGAMPQFGAGESGRKTHSDTIQKMKRLLATSVTRHAKLQHENQQLH